MAAEKEIFTANPFTLPMFSRAKFDYMAQFDVERWSPTVTAPHTFATVTVPLPRITAIAIVHAFQESTCRRSGTVTDADSIELRALERQIEDLFDRIGEVEGSAGQGAARCADGGSFFVRLGPRSPKDAPLVVIDKASESITLGAMLKAAEDLRVVAGCTSSADDVLEVFETASGYLLQVRSAREAISLLTRSSRVMQDLSHALDHDTSKPQDDDDSSSENNDDDKDGDKDGNDFRQGGSGHWNISLVVRRWVPGVQVRREFRGFVASGRLVALSQYDDRISCVEVCEHAQSMAEACHKTFAAAQGAIASLKHAALVVDFAVTRGTPPIDPTAEETSSAASSACWEAHIIELNPFGPMTGSSLFDWNYERRLLQGGRDLFGDLVDHETRFPPGSSPPQRGVEEVEVEGSQVRYRTETGASSTTLEQIEAMYPDFWRIWSTAGAAAVAIEEGIPADE